MIDMDIGNYRGSLQIKEDSGKYYWAVGCDLGDADDWDWQEIPKTLYDEMIKLHKEKSK